MFDTHIHTNNSPDSRQTLDEVCTAALEKGLSAISICDHADMWFIKERHTYDMLKNCIEEVKKARIKYCGRLKILQGIEMSEYLYSPEESKILLNLCDYDVILGSVHSLKRVEPYNGFSATDMSDFSEEMIHTFISDYFMDMSKMIDEFDFDILTHLTLPLRYLNGKYKKGATLSSYSDIIDNILKSIIEKGIALELNTSGIDSLYGDFMPHKEIIFRYKDMGGELITIGSDAHIPQRVGYGFGKAKALLKEAGFEGYYFYEKRKPVKVKL